MPPLALPPHCLSWTPLPASPPVPCPQSLPYLLLALTGVIFVAASVRPESVRLAACGCSTPCPHPPSYLTSQRWTVTRAWNTGACLQVNDRAKVSVKLVAEAGIGVVASGVAKANADVIQVRGGGEH